MIPTLTMRPLFALSVGFMPHIVIDLRLDQDGCFLFKRLQG